MLEELEENPLCPLVVGRIGGVDLTLPVEGQTERFELAAEAVYILLGDNGRMNVVLDGEILGGQRESVPEHRIKHIVALHTTLAADDVKGSVRTGMSYVQTRARRIGEFHQRVKFGLGMVYLGVKTAAFLPFVLPFFLNGGKIVFHSYHSFSKNLAIFIDIKMYYL